MRGRQRQTTRGNSIIYGPFWDSSGFELHIKQKRNVCVCVCEKMQCNKQFYKLRTQLRRIANNYQNSIKAHTDCELQWGVPQSGTDECEKCNGQQVQLGKQKTRKCTCRRWDPISMSLPEKLSLCSLPYLLQHTLHLHDLWSSSASCCVVLKKQAEIWMHVVCAAECVCVKLRIKSALTQKLNYVAAVYACQLCVCVISTYACSLSNLSKWTTVAKGEKGAYSFCVPCKFK